MTQLPFRLNFINGGITLKEGKVEYLQMIQEPICHMSTISAIFKGFAATIVAGIAALPYNEVNTWILGLSFSPVILFAFLDIYYLRLEKQYRFLYEQVRSDTHEIDFSMELTKDNKAAKSRICDCLKSPSIWLFYPIMFAILIIATLDKGKHINNNKMDCQPYRKRRPAMQKGGVFAWQGKEENVPRGGGRNKVFVPPTPEKVRRSSEWQKK